MYALHSPWMPLNLTTVTDEPMKTMKSLATWVWLAGVSHLLVLGSPQAQAETRGFLITSLTPAIYDGGEKSCPGGLITAPDTDLILASLSKSEREQMARPESRAVLAQTVCKTRENGDKQVKASGQKVAGKVTAKGADKKD